MGRPQVLQLFSLALVITVSLNFTGCGSVGANTVTNPSPTPTPVISPTPTPVPSPTPTPTPGVSSRFIYGTPGFESGSIQAGAILSDGSVTPIAGSPFNEGLGQPSIIQVTADSGGRFVYVLNVEAMAVGMQIGNPGIAGFKIDNQTGALTAVPGSPITFPIRNNNLLVLDGQGRFVFEPNGQGNSISTAFDVYSIDQNSGALTKTTSTSNVAPVGEFSVASADGQFLFNAGNGLVQAYTISLSGELLAAPGPAISTGGSAGPLAISVDGKFLYAANSTQGTVAVFAIGTGGTLTAVSGSPFATSPGAESLALTPDGRFLYVAAFTPAGNQTVQGFEVNPVAGSFIPIAGAVINNVDAVAIDLSGKFAYISAPGALITFSINPVTGALLQVSQTTAPSTDDATDLVTVP